MDISIRNTDASPRSSIRVPSTEAGKHLGGSGSYYLRSTRVHALLKIELIFGHVLDIDLPRMVLIFCNGSERPLKPECLRYSAASRDVLVQDLGEDGVALFTREAQNALFEAIARFRTMAEGFDALEARIHDA